MTRRNISLPSDLDAAARRAGLNVSALAQGAIVAELHRQARMTQLDEWLDQLDAEHGPPSAAEVAAAEAWATLAVPAGTEARPTQKALRRTAARTPGTKAAKSAKQGTKPRSTGAGKPRRRAAGR